MSQQKLAKLRRISQIIFFGLFYLHLYRTEFRGTFRVAEGEVRLPMPYPAIFLQSDPLAALVNVLSTGALYQGLLWSLTLLIPTLFLGRFFCGWICPMGTLNHFFSSWKSERKRGLERIERNRYKRWQALKYYVLIAVLVAAVLGSGIAGLFDPLSLLIRSLTLSVLPGLNLALNALFNALYGTHASVLQLLGEGLRILSSHILMSFKQPYFHQGFFIGVILLGLLILNLRITRFWCRALCPLGALLGFLSRWSLLGLEKHPAQCGDCNRCLLNCQGGDDPIPGARWRKAECHLCFNCVGDCPESSIKFKFFPATPTTIEAPDLKRRRAFASIAAGAAALPLFRSTTGLAVERHERLIRPPGALDEKHFLDRCIRCGECMKVCPNNSLQPTLAEAGIEGLWTPVLVPRVGYCEPSCVLCSQVCPTGAIWEITSAEKAWVSSASNKSVKPIHIGTAFYDRGRCLPWALATECIVCEEWCPTSPKAIYLRPAEVFDAQGNAKQVRQPYVDAGRCVGCGACEFACPVQDRPAVYVTSIGETRSKTNQIMMREPRRRATP